MTVETPLPPAEVFIVVEIDYESDRIVACEASYEAAEAKALEAARLTPRSSYAIRRVPIGAPLKVVVPHGVAYIETEVANVLVPRNRSRRYPGPADPVVLPVEPA